MKDLSPAEELRKYSKDVLIRYICRYAVRVNRAALLWLEYEALAAKASQAADRALLKIKAADKSTVAGQREWFQAGKDLDAAMRLHRKADKLWEHSRKEANSNGR